MQTQGNVTTATKTLWATLPWASVGGGSLGQFVKPGVPKPLASRPWIGGDGAWGANPVGSGGVLLLTHALRDAVANGTPNGDGSFTDTSNALGNGTGASYTLWSDSTTGQCFATQI